jgi:hypothetical protein
LSRLPMIFLKAAFCNEIKISFKCIYGSSINRLLLFGKKSIWRSITNHSSKADFVMTFVTLPKNVTYKDWKRKFQKISKITPSCLRLCLASSSKSSTSSSSSSSWKTNSKYRKVRNDKI